MPAAGEVAATPVRVRTACRSDAAALAPLFDAYRVFYGQRTDLAAARAFTDERLAQPTATTWVAVRPDARIVGFMTLYPAQSLVRLGPQLLLEDLFVGAQARRGGVARTLIAHAQGLARAGGCVTITLSTHHTNAAAQALYEQCGFVRDREFFVYTHAPAAP